MLRPRSSLHQGQTSLFLAIGRAVHGIDGEVEYEDSSAHTAKRREEITVRRGHAVH
jgi:hypothetical protein